MFSQKDPVEKEIAAFHELVEREIARLEQIHKIQLYNVKLKDPIEYKKHKGILFEFAIDSER